jgi:hypothetical protein
MTARPSLTRIRRGSSTTEPWQRAHGLALTLPLWRPRRSVRPVPYETVVGLGWRMPNVWEWGRCGCLSITGDLSVTGMMTTGRSRHSLPARHLATECRRQGRRRRSGQHSRTAPACGQAVLLTALIGT